MDRKVRLFKWAYTVFFILILPLILLRLLWRSRKNAHYRKRSLERFGVFKATIKPNGIWIHAVSVGESVAAVPIIQQIQKEFGELPITVTTTTPTGSERIRMVLKDKVFHVYFPYDLPFFVGNFLKRIKPKVCLIMEKELWPNCLWELKKNNIPIFLVNAALSSRSLTRYLYFPNVVKSLLNTVSKVASQSILDSERFLALGLTPEKIQITGNVKFDLVIPTEMMQQALHLRTEWGARPVWIAASTHPGEEEKILAVFQELVAQFKTLLLIIVPRHPERFELVANLVKQHGFTLRRRTEYQSVTSNPQVYLVDTMGELPLFYAASDIAFVGGSLVPIGGHNMLEAAALGLPILVGPYLDNYIEISELLLNAGAMRKVSEGSELANNLYYWLENPGERKRVGDIGKEIVQKNKGAVNKVMDLIRASIA
jgi:3-deoxy-D-manno-octulosonic-acid transferase